jgi:hypothetical protein
MYWKVNLNFQVRKEWLFIMHQSSDTYLQTKQCIEQEHEASTYGLSGPAMVARHEFIEARLTRGANRILKLIEQQRFSEAQLLMEQVSWGKEEVPAPMNVYADGTTIGSGHRASSSKHVGLHEYQNTEMRGGPHL